MANPVLDALLHARADERLQQLRMEPPRSWKTEERRRFMELPYETQRYWVEREKDREKTTRRAQNEAAELRKENAALKAELARLKEQTDATEEK